jgi:hypothetical protein
MPLLHLPATIAPDLTTAILVSAVLNLLMLLGPTMLICGEAMDRLGYCRREKFAGGIALMGLLALFDGLSNYLFWIHCDQAAIGLSLLSCWLLAKDQDTPRIKPRLIGAALLAVLAVWTKQIAVAIPVAQIIHLVLVERDLSRAWKYGICLMGSAGVISGTLLLYFGLDPLVFNLWVIPSGHSFKGWADSARHWVGLAGQAAVLLAVAAAGRWRQRGALEPLRFTVTERLLLTVGIAQIPLNLLGASKVGGGLNSFHSLAFFFTLAALSVVTLLRSMKQNRIHALSGALALSGGLALLAHFGFRTGPAKDLEAMTDLARKHPAQVYFPCNPLITWWTEHKAYHFEYGLIDQAVAGYPASKAHYLEHLPAKLRMVIYPDSWRSKLAPQVISGLHPQTPTAGSLQIYVLEETR